MDARERVIKALDGVYGVDLNPFAVAIARFRLLVAAVLLIAVYVIGNRGIQTGISSVTGRPVSDGAPMIAWVQMGLEESKRGPG